MNDELNERAQLVVDTKQSKLHIYIGITYSTCGKELHAL